MTISEVLSVWSNVCEQHNIKWYLYRETLLCANGYGNLPNALPYAQVIVHTKDIVTVKHNVLCYLPKNWAAELNSEKSPSCFMLYNQHRKGILSVECLEPLNHLDPEGNCVWNPEWFEGSETVECNGTLYPVFAGYKDYLAAQYGDYEDGLFDDIGCGLTKEDKLDLKNHQQKCKEALQYVKEMGEKYNLRYYLIAGSVLGAVRHNGFIPWDDDIDIGIRIEDRERFEHIIKKNLPNDFTFEEAKPNHPYPRMFSKICYNGRCCIDLWPLIPTYTEGVKGKFTWYMGKIIRKLHYKKIGYQVTKFDGIANVFSRLISDEKVMRLANKNETLFARRKTPAYINLYSIYRREKELIMREWIDTPAHAKFEDIEVPIIGCTDAYLTHLYGNYMQKPVPWKRASKHFSRFTSNNQQMFTDK